MLHARCVRRRRSGAEVLPRWGTGCRAPTRTRKWITPRRSATLLFRLGKTIEAVEGRGLVAFRERRIVEDGVLEISDFAFEEHYGLADMQQFGVIFDEAAPTEKFECFAVEQ